MKSSFDGPEIGNQIQDFQFKGAKGRAARNATAGERARNRCRSINRYDRQIRKEEANCRYGEGAMPGGSSSWNAASTAASPTTKSLPLSEAFSNRWLWGVEIP